MDSLYAHQMINEEITKYSKKNGKKIAVIDHAERRELSHLLDN